MKKGSDAGIERPGADIAGPSADIAKTEVVTGTDPKVAGLARKPQTTSGSGMLERAASACPYCQSNDFVKRGLRENKHQSVQLYVCRNPACGRTFTSRTIKGKQFPWPVVLDAISYHNLGYTFEQVSKILEHKFFRNSGADVEKAEVASGTNPKGTKGHAAKARATSAAPQPETIAKWYEDYKPLCRFERLRPYAMKILAAWKARSPKTKFEMVETTTLAHRQLYRFRYHRPKLILMLEEYKNRSFGRLMEYLDAVSTETPHQYFADGERMSEIKSKFDKAEMIVKGKNNFANELTKFVLQGVPENKERHEALQRFLVANDSVTVATEVPVYIRREDIEHMQNVLKFNVVGEEGVVLRGRESRNAKRAATSAPRLRPFPKLLTGHIDVVQVRNGIVHILDYKPGAAKEKPIEQLTWYALALSRLTGLRLYEFKCAWFDEHDYFEFYPLHVVKKLQRKRTKRVHDKDGSVAEIPKENVLTVVERSL